MLQYLAALDRKLFLLINGWNSPFWDVVMEWVTARNTWIPLYAALLIFLVWHYKWQIWKVALAIAATITIADQVASAVIKPWAHRPRPCHNPAIEKLVHMVDGCGGAYGFVSSHAANTFGLALLLWLLVGKRYSWLVWLFPWAVLVSYSRIYVGAHYPLDLIGGGLLGMAVAGAVYAVGRLAHGKWFLRKGQI